MLFAKIKKLEFSLRLPDRKKKFLKFFCSFHLFIIFHKLAAEVFEGTPKGSINESLVNQYRPPC